MDILKDISNEIKNIQFEIVLKEWNLLKQLSSDSIQNINGRSKIGCNFIDYYFFINRIETIGSKGINFFDFLKNIEFYKSKKYIQTLLSFCEKNNRYTDSEIKKYYYCYGLCFGRINAFKITNAVQIYQQFKPMTVLDPFCGFGGRLTGALLLDINYIGIDLNIDLEQGYKKLMNDFGNKSNSIVQLFFQDSLKIDYSQFKYDMVFTSPPYRNIEIYKYSEKRSIEGWTTFYNAIFKILWANLELHGTFIININETIYHSVLEPLFGPASIKNLLKKTDKNKYKEYIYIWIKELN